MNKPANYLRQPATFAGNGRLYRGIVSLPNHMTNGAFEERIVFFESKTEQAVGAHLEALLKKVWCRYKGLVRGRYDLQHQLGPRTV